MALWGLGGSIDAIGDLISQKKYTYFEGKAKEKKIDSPSLMTWNACMLWGGLPILFGGVRPARERIDEVAKLILEKKPDILVMQEVSFEAATSLWKRLKHQYAHGFSRIAPMPWLCLDTGLFVATQVPLIKPPFYYPLPTNGTIQRGVFCFETEFQVFFVTHLEAGSSPDDSAMRKKQVDEILVEMKKVQGKPVFLIGDLNIHQKDGITDEYAAHLAPYFHQFFQPKGKETATCTEDLTAYARGKIAPENSWEHIDYILISKSTQKPPSLEIEQIPTYGPLFKEALSDHKAIYSIIKKY